MRRYHTDGFLSFLMGIQHSLDHISESTRIIRIKIAGYTRFTFQSALLALDPLFFFSERNAHPLEFFEDRDIDLRYDRNMNAQFLYLAFED